MQSDSKIYFERMLLKAHKRLFFLALTAILSGVSLHNYYYFVRVSWSGKKKNASSRPLEW